MAEPLVSVREGKLLGSVKSDLNGKTFFSFQGIPYAKPPLGELRFKAPQPPEKWKGVRDATKEGSECYAKGISAYVGSEDCLVLNVFTREISGSTLKPVMFWIHGGGFTSSSGNSDLYGPEFLLTEDIVLVTFNYRLGPLGFLRLRDPSLGVPGNAGLKDMVMALKWVQRNIKQFSGDPNNVTIFGESAGGAAVHLLMLSPMAKGLFHKAISQSGCATNVWASCSKYTIHQLAENLGVYTNDEELLLKHLRNVSLEELFRASEKIPDHLMVGVFRPFGPVVEEPSDEEAFLSEDPSTIMKSGNYTKVPLITGCCNREGMFVYSLCITGKTNKLLLDETVVPRSMNLRVGSDIYKRAVEEIKRFYFHDNENPLTDLDNIYRLYTDNAFQYEVYKTAKSHLDSSKTPIFFYNFSLDTELNFMKPLYGMNEPGVCHAEDIAYLFKSFFTPDIEPGSAELVGILRMVKLWANFAKYGNPTPTNDDPLLPVKWSPITANSFQVLDIGEELKILPDHPERKAMEFWDRMHMIKPINSKL
ncbi:juvenile hormone esterase isoform X1 [Leptinotarsa decemlineata]|uniref:juvenile hormone esterase isoform X1 n=1 Tax=Leptinotarsa decemlineata TaxID=7539 RepID=UPI003D30BF2E